MPADRALTPEEALHTVRQRFPISGYMSELSSGYLNLCHTVMRYVPPGGKILDFGAGACNKTALLQLLGYQCSACDDLSDPWHQRPGVREKLLEFIRDIGIDFHCEPGWTFPKEHYDMVMVLHVLEHLHDSPRDLLNDLLEATKPRGYLYLVIPNITNIRKRLALLRGRSVLESYGRYYWTPGPWRGHVREYARDELEQLARYLRLEICELTGVHEMLGRLPRSTHAIYKALTLLAPGWRDSWMMIARKPPNWSPQREAPPEFAHFLTKRNIDQAAGEREAPAEPRAADYSARQEPRPP